MSSLIEALSRAVADLTRRVEKLEQARGTPGSGACICRSRPDRNRKHPDGFLFDTLNSALDHRCPKHGEKAQPALWGRHKDLELIVTPAQWDALGVTRND